MDHHDELDQQVWEFVYDLLPEQEAAGLRQRITSEPEVARAYVRVKLRSELVADAARIAAPPLTLQRPTDGVQAVSTAGARRKTRARRAMAARAANALTALAAAVLVCVMGYGYFQPRTPGRAAVEAPLELVRAEVSVPKRIHPEATNLISVSTTTLHGTPLPTRVAYRFFDARGGVALHRDVTTNNEGYAQIMLPRSIARSVTGLEITAGDELSNTIRTDLHQAETQHLTYLALDKQEYLPGETVQFRSVTLSQLELVSSHEVLTEFRVFGPDQQSLPDPPQKTRTDRGVGSGSFQLSAQATPGPYTVAVRSPDAEFNEVRQSFAVREPHSLRVDLQLARNSHPAGEEVIGQLQVFRANGDPAAGAELKADATVAGQRLVDMALPTAADERGYGQFRLQVPVSLSRRSGVLNLQIKDRDQETTVSQEIPAGGSDPTVTFFPEGGELVPGCPNRVYFLSRDAQGHPAELSGRILNDQGVEVAVVRTLDDGRGSFRLTPEAGQTYSLDIQDPVNVSVRPELPPVPLQVRANLVVEQPVLQPRAPVEARLRATRLEGGLLVAAYCRGVLVGQQRVDNSRFAPDDSGFSCQLQLPLSDEAVGAIRVAVLDYEKDPPETLSERLVFRRPERQLRLRVEPLPELHPPTANQRLQITTLDENDQPLQAVVGLAITSVGSPQVTVPKPAMAAYYYLAAELERPDEIGDGLRYLSDDTNSQTALDLLLGTQSWQRYRWAPPEMIARAEMEALSSQSQAIPAQEEKVSELAMGFGHFGMASTAGFRPMVNRGLETPVLLNNSADLVRSLAPTPSAPLFDVDRQVLGRWLLWGGAFLAGASVLIMLLKFSQRAAHLVPVFATAVASLLIGIMWGGVEQPFTARVAQAPSAPTTNADVVSDSAMRRSEPVVGKVAGTMPPLAPELSPARDIEGRPDPTAESLPAEAQKLKELPSLEFAEQQQDVSQALAGAPATARGAAIVDQEPLAGSAGISDSARGGGLAMKAMPPQPEMLMAPAPAQPSQNVLPEAPEPLLSQPGVGQIASPPLDPAAAPRPDVAEASAPRSVAASATAGGRMRMTPRPTAAPVAGNYGLPARGKAEVGGWFYGAVGQPVAGGADVPTTLYWAPEWQPDESGRTLLSVPRRGSYRIHVRADGHAAGRLGSADVAVEIPTSDPPD